MTPELHPCDCCPRCDPTKNETTHQCPVKTGELKVCDQFRCWVCNEHFYNLEQERSSSPTSAEQVLEAFEEWILTYDHNSMFKWEVQQKWKELRSQRGRE